MNWHTCDLFRLYLIFEPIVLGLKKSGYGYIFCSQIPKYKWRSYHSERHLVCITMHICAEAPISWMSRVFAQMSPVLDKCIFLSFFDNIDPF